MRILQAGLAFGKGPLVDFPVSRELAHGVDGALQCHQDRGRPGADLGPQLEPFRVQLLRQLPNRPQDGAQTSADQGRHGAAGGAGDVLDPSQFLGFVQAVGNKLHGAETEAGKGAADGAHLLPGGAGSGHQVARLVDVPVEAGGGEAEGTGPEGAAGDAAHLGHVLARGVVVAALAHYIVADGDMGRLGSDVHRVRGIDVVEVFGEGLPAPRDAVVQRRAGYVLDALHQFDQFAFGARPHRGEADPAIAHHDGSDPVPAARRHLFVPTDLAVVVGVDVHEAGGQQVAFGIDDPLGLGWTAASRRDFGDRAAVGDHIGADRLGAGAVDEGGVLDDEIVHGPRVPERDFQMES